jgi:hypothetical protein
MEKKRAAILATCAIIILLLAFTGVAVHLSMISDNKAKNVPVKNNPNENDLGGSPSGDKAETTQPNDNNGNQQTLVVVEPEPPCKCPFKRGQQQSHVNPPDSSVLLVSDISNEQMNAIPTLDPSTYNNSSIDFNELRTRKWQDIS